jgi:cytosine/adenosine deaminase-related metal-dependent hydrolase
MVGSLEAGKEFDALVIDAGGGAGFDLFPGRDGPLQMLEKFLNNGDDRHIAAVYVQGRRVVGG